MPQNDDRLAITNQLGLFARMIDARDWAGASAVFAEDVAFNYGDGGEQVGLDALIGQFRRFLDHCGPSQHLIGSIMLELDAETAVTRAYVQARHQGLGARATLFFDSNGEYVDRWSRLAQGWRIVRRDAIWATHMGDPRVLMEDLAAPS